MLMLLCAPADTLRVSFMYFGSKHTKLKATYRATYRWQSTEQYYSIKQKGQLWTNVIARKPNFK